MYTLSVKSDFSAAHNLRGYKGKCEALHGHNWKVEAVIAAKKLDAQGLVLDFHIIKEVLNEILDEFDHKYLNEHSYFKKHNPTSENLARYIYEKLDGKLPARLRLPDCACPTASFGRVVRAGRSDWDVAGGRLQKVTVWESDNCSAAYSK